MSPIIVHQAKEYYQYLQFNIPLECTVHNTPSGYMDRDGWLKATYQFSDICGGALVNNQMTFFDVNESHFDERALRQMKCRYSQPFVLKSGY